MKLLTAIKQGLGRQASVLAKKASDEEVREALRYVNDKDDMGTNPKFVRMEKILQNRLKSSNEGSDKVLKSVLPKKRSSKKRSRSTKKRTSKKRSSKKRSIL